MSANRGDRLRAAPLQPPIHIVLIEPEIPQNTGSIARLCAAIQAPLHLVGPLGFRIDDRTLKRAGIDYWNLVQVHRHLDFAHFRHALPNANLYFYSAKSDKAYVKASVKPGDALIFGRESVGLPAHLTDDHPGCVYSIPTMGAVRSLNLANAVSIVAYEALRQLGVLDTTFLD